MVVDTDLPAHALGQALGQRQPQAQAACSRTRPWLVSLIALSTSASRICPSRGPSTGSGPGSAGSARRSSTRPRAWATGSQVWRTPSSKAGKSASPADGWGLGVGQRQRLARQIRRQPLGATGARGVGSGQQGAAIVGGEQVFSHR